MLPYPETDVIHLRALILSGSADDPAGKEGIAWFTAHLLLREAESRLAGKHGQESLTENGSLAVEVGKDAILLSGSITPGRFERLYEALHDTILRPAFATDTAAEQRAAQKAEAERLRRDEARLVHLALDALLYRNHPYGRPDVGSPSTIDSLAPEDARAFHARHFRKGNIVLGVAGPVESALGERLRRDFDALPDGAPERAAREVTHLPGRRALIVEERSAARVRILLGHSIPVTAAHPDFHALNLAASRLEDGRGAPGRLSRALAAAGVDAVARAAMGADPGGGEQPREGDPALPRRQASFVVEIDASRAEGPESLARVLETLEEATVTDPTVEGLRAAKESALGGRRRTIPEHDLRQRLLEMVTGARGFSGRFARSLEEVAAGDVTRAARAHIRPERVGIVALVPDAEAFRQALLAAGAVPGETGAGGSGLRPGEIQILTAADLLR